MCGSRWILVTDKDHQLSCTPVFRKLQYLPLHGHVCVPCTIDNHVQLCSRDVEGTLASPNMLRNFLKCVTGVGEIAQWLRILAAFSEDRGLRSSTRMASSIILVPWDLTLSSTSGIPGTQVVRRHM